MGPLESRVNDRWNRRKMKIGFMQGRLLPLVNNRIQCFPGKAWSDELALARSLNLDLIEWTIDTETMSLNPILNSGQHDFIVQELLDHKIGLESVTCDFFMEKPPWESAANFELNQDFFSVIRDFVDKIGPLKLVVPLVDKGSPPTVNVLSKVVFPLFEKYSSDELLFLLESDYEPTILSRIVNANRKTPVGINLDFGNSASLGWDARSEVVTLNRLIKNVHVKDRVIGGGSVRLGRGATDFSTYLEALKQIEYNNNFILQTARSQNEQHFEELSLNLQFFRSALEKAGFN